MLTVPSIYLFRPKKTEVAFVEAWSAVNLAKLVKHLLLFASQRFTVDCNVSLLDLFFFFPVRNLDFLVEKMS